MLSVNVEQRVGVKLCVELEKCATETHGLLKKVCGDECRFGTEFFEWFKWSKEGRKGRDMRRSASLSPQHIKGEANIEKVGEIFRQNQHLIIRAFDELINIDKETVRHILHNNFNMKKKCVRRLCRDCSLLNGRKLE